MLNPLTHRKILRTVRVDSDNPERVAIDWDGVGEQYERGKAARREALASGQPAGLDAGTLAGVDAGALTDEELAEQKRRVLDGP